VFLGTIELVSRRLDLVNRSGKAMGAMSALAKAERPQSGTGIPAPHPALIGKYRWVICALLFLGTTVNYVDRQVIGLLKPVAGRRRP
jgi:hypothetical protein